MPRIIIPAFLKEGWDFFNLLKPVTIMNQILTSKLMRKDYFFRLDAKFRKVFLFVLSSSLVLIISFTHLLFVDKALSQSNIKIEGYVYDHGSGHPVAGAEVKIANTSYQVTSDNSGFYFFEKLPVGSYSMEVYSLEYEKEIVSEIEVTEDITRKISIYLKRKVFVLPPVEVTAERVPILSGSVEIIDKEKIKTLDVNSVAEVLETFEGIFVQKTGTVAGRHEISIRGSSPKDVLVLIDNQKINPSASGEVDLNTIPLEIVEKIEVYKGGASSKYGADALAGAVNIITHPQAINSDTKAQAKNYWGSWESDIFNFSLRNPLIIPNLTTNLAYTYRTSKGDFEYDDPKKGLSRRENAYKRGFNFFFSGLHSFNPKTHLGFSAQLYRSQNGIPGALYQLTKSALLNDSRRLINLKFKQELSKKISLEIRFGFLRFMQHFKSAEDLVKYDSRYVDDILDFSLGFEFHPLPQNRLEWGGELQKDMLNHKDYHRPGSSMGNITRETKSLFLTESQGLSLPRCLFLRNLNLNFSLRHDRPEGLEDFTSSQIGATLSGGTESKIILRSSYGKSYRQPSNNALFWKEDVWSAGNPDLLPEKSDNYEMGSEIRVPFLSRFNLNAGITFFHSFVRDIIVWRRRFDGRYMPVNISKAKITGHEDFIKWSLFQEKIEISYQNTVVKALNKSGDRIYDGKFIPFRPCYVTNLEYRLNYWLFRFSHKLRWVSERYTLEANTKREKPYHLEELCLGLKKQFPRWEVKLNLQIKNLTNEKYILIQNHPMPGREWGVSLQLIYGVRK